MKKFKLTIYKGHEAKQSKIVTANSIFDLKAQKSGFWMESPYKKGVNKNWMGVKRIS